MSLIRIIVGSARPVRVGDQLAAEIAPLIAQETGAEVEIVDLRALDLPMLDEPRMPALGDYAHDHTKSWSSLIDGADGVVFLTPQYNGGYPASLKNAIDFLFAEWRDKPALLLSYGGHGGGMAADQLGHVLRFIGVDLIGDSVPITLGRDDYGPDGRLVDAASPIVAVADDLRQAGRALAAALEPVPAV